MNLFTRRACAVLVAACVALLASVGVAHADSLRIDVPGAPATTYAYFSGDQASMGGEVILCVNNTYFGGYRTADGQGGYFNESNCPDKTADTTLPPAGGGGGGPTAPCTDAASCAAAIAALIGCDSPQTCQDKYFGGGGGGGAPAPPCTDQASCEAFFGGLLGGGGGGAPAPPCTDQASCEAFFGGLVGGGGGGGAPAPPCTDQASCEAFFGGLLGGGGGGGGGGAPSSRDCTSRSGGSATCIDFDAGNYLVLDPPDDGQGELGFCTNNAQAPDGPGYYYVSGPDPDGGHDDACPTAASEPPPASDGGGTGSDAGGDTSSSSGTQSSGGSDQSAPSSDGQQTTQTSSGTTQERSSQPLEAPLVALRRTLLKVSKRWRVAVPLACRSVSTRCVGKFRLTATRRRADGHRVRVLLAKGKFSIAAGGKATKRPKLTRAGRRMLKNGPRSRRARLRTVAVGESGSVVRREPVIVRR